MFSRSQFNKEYFVIALKIAKVTPIFKSGDKGNVSSYHPTSILPVFSKILERMMYNRVYNHLDSKDLLYEKQFGFQRNNSTERAILQLTRDITGSFEKGEYTLGVFIDLSKAFDTVDHQILIKKLQYYGIDGTALEWFKSYLSNRKQYISSQNVSENCLDIICGVPQGSILGPLLFLIYVNDLFKASNPLMELMFADDTNLFMSHKNTDILFDSMNVELANVSTWFKSNKLSLNVDKTKWLLFHPLSKRQLLPQTLPNLLIENIHIKREHTAKCAGVFIDENLSWKQQKLSKISKSIRILYKSRDVLKVVSAIFLLVCYLSLNDSTCQTRKNVFYFTSKALFVLENILEFYVFKFHDVTECLSIKEEVYFTE